jgi:uncharacterized membrane protein YkoI
MDRAARHVFALVLIAAAGPAAAADPAVCLSQDQRRSAIATHRAMPLARALRGVRGRLGGEVIRARLCYHGEELVYVLTVLARDGKVTRTSVNAASGAIVEAE